MAFVGDVDSRQYEQALKAACSLEVLHTATLIQDDIFDSGHTRRSRTTTHLVYGTPLAILASDWLLLEAARLAVEVNPAFTMVLGRAAQAMTVAEALELCPPKNDSLDQARSYVEEVAAGKTGALFAAAMAGAATIRNLQPIQVESLWDLRREFGITFQMMDDGKDLFSTHEQTGKDVRQDVFAGRLTMPLLLACSGWIGQEDATTVVRDLLHRRLSRRQGRELCRLFDNTFKGALRQQISLRHDTHRSAIEAADLPASVDALVQWSCEVRF